MQRFISFVFLWLVAGAMYLSCRAGASVDAMLTNGVRSPPLAS